MGAKKKVKKEPEQGISEKAQHENDPKETSSKSSRSYRKKDAGPEEKENEGNEEETVKLARRKKKEKNNSKPELPRYDVRRILDKKKEEKKEKKEKSVKNGVPVDAVKKTEDDHSKDEFGRDVE